MGLLLRGRGAVLYPKGFSLSLSFSLFSLCSLSCLFCSSPCSVTILISSLFQCGGVVLLLLLLLLATNLTAPLPLTFCPVLRTRTVGPLVLLSPVEVGGLPRIRNLFIPPVGSSG